MRAESRLPRLKAWWAKLGRGFCEGWRALTGEDAYGCYLKHHAVHHPETPPLAEADFWREEIERRYSGIRRCC